MWEPNYCTMEELKEYTRVEVTDDLDDPIFATCVAGASRAVDHFCNRQFGTLDAVEERFYTARPNFRLGKFEVDIDDLMTATGLIVAVDGTATTDYVRLDRNAAAEGKPWTRLRLATVSLSDLEVSVTGQWGWTSIPTAVKLATLEQGSRFFKRRVAPFGVAGSPEQGSEVRLLARVDPDVAVNLAKYRRPRMPR